jgi:starvation-inducible outer membrane lipoprotein
MFHMARVVKKGGSSSDVGLLVLELLPIAALLAMLCAGCATAPKPIELDGADRVPVNDPATVEKLKRMATERN